MSQVNQGISEAYPCACEGSMCEVCSCKENILGGSAEVSRVTQGQREAYPCTCEGSMCEVCSCETAQRNYISSVTKDNKKLVEMQKGDSEIGSLYVYLEKGALRSSSQALCCGKLAVRRYRWSTLSS